MKFNSFKDDIQIVVYWKIIKKTALFEQYRKAMGYG